MWNKPILDERVNSAIREGVSSQQVARLVKGGSRKPSVIIRLLSSLRRFKAQRAADKDLKDDARRLASSRSRESEIV